MIIMEKIIDLHYDFFREVMNDRMIDAILEKEEVEILEGFIHNIDQVRNFYETVYSKGANRIVLCGINPGKNGAGKTGIPFLDNEAVSKFLPNVKERDWERSARFIMSVINEIGKERFFENVYLTNISWFGFLKERNNYNYYQLPTPLPSIFTKTFIQEMNIVQPLVIIPLSKEVEKTLIQMKKVGVLHYPIGIRLNHPYYCSIKNNELQQRAEYINRIMNFIVDKDLARK